MSSLHDQISFVLIDHESFNGYLNWFDKNEDDIQNFSSNLPEMLNHLDDEDDTFLSKPSPLSKSSTETQPPSPLTLPEGLPPPAKSMSYVTAASKAVPPTLSLGTLGKPITSSCLTAPGLTEISKGLHEFFMACDKQQQQPSIDTDFTEKVENRFITVENRIDEQDRFRKEIEKIEISEKLVTIHWLSHSCH